MRYVVPTYQRTGIVQDKTLALLSRHNINPADVLILVADDAELRAYRDALDREWHPSLHITARGLVASRQVAIDTLLSEGEEVIWLDDDVDDVEIRLNEKQLAPCDDITGLFAEGFSACRTVGSHLFGLYAVRNPFFMKPKVRTGLSHCIGCLYGQIIRRDARLHLRYGDPKEDYERCLRHWQLDGTVARLEYAVPVSKYLRAEGGLHESRTLAAVEENVRGIKSEWPDLVRVRFKKGTPHPEIILKA